MISQKIPIGVRLGVSHYWQIPYYKFKCIAFSQSMLKYLKLLITVFFVRFKKLRKNKPGSIYIDEFFITTAFNFWEFETVNVFINFLGNLYVRPRYVPRKYFFSLKAKIKKRLILGRILSTYKVKHRKAVRRNYYSRLNRYLGIKNLLNYYKNTFIKGQSGTSKEIFNNKFLKSYNILPSYTWGDKKKNRFSNRFTFNLEFLLNIISYTAKVSYNYTVNKLTKYLTEYLGRAIKKNFNISINFGWSLASYFYYCYILYMTFLDKLSANKNLAKFYLFYRRSVLLLLVRDIASLFYSLKTSMVARKIKTVRDPNSIFVKHIRRLGILPLKSLGVKSINIQFNGRVWGRKKNWARTKRVSVSGITNNPLSTLKETYIYHAEGFSTKFGIYGLKVWLVSDEPALTRLINSTIDRMQDKIYKLTNEESYFLNSGLTWVKT